MLTRSISTWAAVSMVGMLAGAALAQEKPANQTQSTTPNPNQNAAQPRVEFSSELWNFGQVWYGEPAETKIEIRNTGKAPLQILNVKSSCGCTAAKPSKKVLAPGESDQIEIKYNTKKNAPKVNQRITIQTNDPTRPEVQLRVTGEVRHVFSTNPSYARLAFPQVMVDSKDEVSIELTSNMDQPIHPKLKPLPPNTPFEIEMQELVPGKKYKLIARTIPPLRSGPNSAQLELETGVERLPIMTIPVTASATERVAVRPPSLRLFNTQDGRPITRMLRLTYLKDQPIEVQKIESSDPGIEASVIDSKYVAPTANMFTTKNIKVYVPDWDLLPAGTVTLTIFTNDKDPRFQKIEIPVQKHEPRTTRAAGNRRSVAGPPAALARPQPAPQEPKAAEPKPGPATGNAKSEGKATANAGSGDAKDK